MESGKQNAKENYETKARELKKAYEAALEKLNNDTLKRGLARSSIAVDGSNRIAGAYAGDSRAAIEDYSKEIEDLDKEIGSLDVNLTKALNEFNIKQAAALTEKINELKAERQARQEYEAKTQKAKTESDLYGEALDQKKKEDSFNEKLSDEGKAERMRNIYEKAYALLSEMSKEEAFETLTTEPVFRNSLNDYYFFTLYYKFR